MDLYFLRHGKAADPVGADDFSRELTPQGIEEMEAEAERLEELGLELDVILTSPLRRAVQTAEIVARRLKLKKKLAESDLLSPGCDLARLRKLLELHPESERIMVVGHEPDLSAIIAELISARESGIEVKKGGLARVRTTGTPRSGAGVLEWLIPPRLLRRD
jgi:phosphohistidine phosphatase